MEPKKFIELFADAYSDLLLTQTPEKVKGELSKIVVHSARVKGSMSSSALASQLTFYGRSYHYWLERIDKLDEAPLKLSFDKGELSLEMPNLNDSGPLLDKLIFECACKSHALLGLPIESFVSMYKLQADMVKKEKNFDNDVSLFTNVATRLFGQNRYSDMYSVLKNVPDKVLQVNLVFKMGVPKLTDWKVI